MPISSQWQPFRKRVFENEVVILTPWPLCFSVQSSGHSYTMTIVFQCSIKWSFLHHDHCVSVFNELVILTPWPLFFSVQWSGHSYTMTIVFQCSIKWSFLHHDHCFSVFNELVILTPWPLFFSVQWSGHSYTMTIVFQCSMKWSFLHHDHCFSVFNEVGILPPWPLFFSVQWTATVYCCSFKQLINMPKQSQTPSGTIIETCQNDNYQSLVSLNQSKGKQFSNTITQYSFMVGPRALERTNTLKLMGS
jgi:hypothetical protein